MLDWWNADHWVKIAGVLTSLVGLFTAIITLRRDRTPIIRAQPKSRDKLPARPHMPNILTTFAHLCP